MAWHPTLDDMERKPDGPREQRWSQFRDNRDPETVAKIGYMGGGNCWCGNKEAWHDWEGKADGAPHPR